MTDGWGYVAIEDMIINNVPTGPIQDVLTYVFSEANAPIVILPPHVINGLCKYSNKHYLQVMTPFHASELLAKNSLLLSRLTTEQKLNLLKYIVFNDPDPGLVLELELLPLANGAFISFQTKQAARIYVIANNDAEFLNLFSSRSYDRFLCPDLDVNLFEKLSSQSFQGKLLIYSESTLIDHLLMSRYFFSPTVYFHFTTSSCSLIIKKQQLRNLKSETETMYTGGVFFVFWFVSNDFLLLLPRHFHFPPPPLSLALAHRCSLHCLQ